MLCPPSGSCRSYVKQQCSGLAVPTSQLQPLCPYLALETLPHLFPFASKSVNVQVVMRGKGNGLHDRIGHGEETMPYPQLIQMPGFSLPRLALILSISGLLVAVEKA